MLMASPQTSIRTSGTQPANGGVWAQAIRTNSGGPRAWADYTPTPGAGAVSSFKFNMSGNFSQSGRMMSAAATSPMPPVPILTSFSGDEMKKVNSGPIPSTPGTVWPQTPDGCSPNPYAAVRPSAGLPLQPLPEPMDSARMQAEMKLAAGRQILNEAFRVKNTFIEFDSDDEEDVPIGVPRGQSAPVIPVRALGSIGPASRATALVVPMGSITESDVTAAQAEPAPPEPQPSGGLVAMGASFRATDLAPAAPMAAPYVAPYVAQYNPAMQVSNGLPSKGSVTHGTGKCRPCAWFFKDQGCSNDYECGYCHLCPEGELKARKKSKVTAMRIGALAPAKPGMPSGPRTLKLAPMLDA